MLKPLMTSRNLLSSQEVSCDNYSCSSCSSCASRGKRSWIWPAILLTVVGLVFVASILGLPRLSPTFITTKPVALVQDTASLTAAEVGQTALAHDAVHSAPVPSINQAVPNIVNQAVPNINQKDLLAALLRRGSHPHGISTADYPELDVLLATPTYFSLTGRQPPASALEQPSFIFYVSESVHTGQLPTLPARPLLRAGRIDHQPAELNVLTDSPHHRTSMVRYRAVWADGSAVIAPGDHSLKLVFPTEDAAEPAGSVLSWDLPISYGAAYSSEALSVGGTSLLPPAAGILSSAEASDHNDSRTGPLGAEVHHDHGAAPANLPNLWSSSLTPGDDM